MDRLAHKYVKMELGVPFRGWVDETPEEFAETMGYKNFNPLGRVSFLMENGASEWELELNALFERILDKKKSYLFLGSGVGEQEVPLHLKGYRVIASDVYVDALEKTKKLFPSLPIAKVDAFHLPDRSWFKNDGGYVDTGIMFYYPWHDALRIFNEVTLETQDNDVFIVCHRYNDNTLTWLLDEVFLPIEALLKNTAMKILGKNVRWVRKEHGFRRPEEDVVQMAEDMGLKLVSKHYVGYGWELNRLWIVQKFPFIRRLAAVVDKKLKMLAAVCVFEFQQLG